jgi:hypothetical protein
VGLAALGVPAWAEAPVAIRNRSREAYWVASPRTPESIVVTLMLESGEIKPPLRFPRNGEVGFALPAKGVAWIDTADSHLNYCNDFQIMDRGGKRPVARFNYQVVVTRKLATLKPSFKRIRILGGGDAGPVTVNAGGSVLVIGELNGPRAKGLSPHGSSASGRSAAAG